MVKTLPKGDKCYAFCPPSIYCQAPTPACSQYLLLTDHLSPIYQAVSILLLREPAELLISSHVVYISICLFRWTVPPQLI